MTVHAGPASCRFGPLTVEYDDRVLEPRPWTFAQSEWAAELHPGVADGPILELCAGAGHIGLAAAALTGRALVAVEADPVAADFARTNAATAGLAGRVSVRQRDLRCALTSAERFPLILADPPYLPTAEIADWPADPVAAIDGGRDGLDLVRTCLAVAAGHLAPGGRMVLQVAGPAQADVAAHLLDGTPLAPAEVRVTDSRRALLLVERP